MTWRSASFIGGPDKGALAVVYTVLWGTMTIILKNLLLPLSIRGMISALASLT